MTATELRELISEELESLGFSFDEKGDLIPPAPEKESIKLLHKPSREIELEKAQDWINFKLPRYIHFFANGQDISPKSIKPTIIQVCEKWHNDLFRLARYYWSIPYSFGFGRRLRYLIIDDSNGKLMGIFGLQSPPIGFPARDRLFNYPYGRKTELVNQTMDIFTLGALPPYNRLLGGKLVALATVTNEVREAYRKIYLGRKTEMEDRVIPAELVALTTTSAFGRSSIYNRLKYQDLLIAESIGYTNGYGNFHLQRLYPAFKQYLESEDISIQGGYGTGPKRTWQLIRRTLDHIGVSGDILRHGIKREAFLFRLIDNLDDYLNGKTETPIYRNLPFESLAEFWRERWLYGRSERVDSWHNWNNQDIAKSLAITKPISEN
ncbi:MAG: DUF4338 domain-containing protein [Anaerolineales bacterium]|nr:DUF4338 domain-containing protein [Anaerolineales bacterium]